MVNTPIPHSLKSEAKKAAKILKDFSIPSSKTGPDAIIPVGLLVNAEGLAILTVAKIGFLVTARAGSGIVIAKCDDGSWSAPSAIGIAGLGGGLEIGAEVTDFVIILTKKSAVQAFSKGGNLTLGGNLTIAAGPLGRNVEGDVSMRSPAAIYTYSKTKGLFAGISIEGSALIERKDANKKFYGSGIRAYDILGGEVSQPQECFELYEVLSQHRKMFERMMVAVAKREASKQVHKAAEGAGLLTRVKSLKLPGRTQKKRKEGSSGSKSTKGGQSADYYSSDSDDEQQIRRSQSMTFSGGATSRQRAASMPVSTGEAAASRTSGGQTKYSYSQGATSADWDSHPRAKAMWSYEAQMPCDLTFKPGDEIDILTRTHTQDDWWEGRLGDKVGIFPANYVHIM